MNNEVRVMNCSLLVINCGYQVARHKYQDSLGTYGRLTSFKRLPVFDW